jgi:ribosome-associated translation inhibitor RaiA/cold shock CspA family protein
MERPLDIAFHNIDSSESLEFLIREHVEKLEKRFPHLIGCRVSVEALHHSQVKGNVPDIHITLSVPGRDLAVSREPQKAQQRRNHPTIQAAVKDAFKAAERQLESFKGKLREDTSKPTGSALAGQVALIEPGADHGYLLNSSGTQLYFHRDSVTNGDFADLKQGTLVHYVEEEGDAGPVATKVRIPVTPSAGEERAA